jgi:hypothetical protein
MDRAYIYPCQKPKFIGCEGCPIENNCINKYRYNRGDKE